MWGTPKCPVVVEEKEWLEKGMSWLARQFGMSRLREQTIILPTDQFFPDPLDGTEEAAKKVYTRVCKYMDVAPERAIFEVFEDDAPPKIKEAMEWSHNGAAGYFMGGKTPTVSVEQNSLTDPMSLVATCAHELGHLLLSNRDLSAFEEEDEEPLTDLLTVFFGMGIFCANSCISFKQSEGDVGFHTTSWSSKGYLELYEWGYAHSLLAHGRGETKPKWISHLRPDAADVCKRGIKYIQKTGDVNFPPNDKS
ncbi:MAG: hypothetical protein ACYTDT_00300 [Planctomycetota bacterium]|jgi:hypothetical protein